MSFFHLVMVYEKKEFYNLYNALHVCFDEIHAEVNKDYKSIGFSTPLSSMRLRYSPGDIEQLLYLVETFWLITNDEKNIIPASCLENTAFYH